MHPNNKIRHLIQEEGINTYPCVVNIGFNNRDAYGEISYEDETQLDPTSEENLISLWREFCKDNCLFLSDITYIHLVKTEENNG